MAVNPVYERMLKESEVYVLPDFPPWSAFGYSLDNTAILEALMTDLSISTGPSIGGCSLKFPKKQFGDHVGANVPIKIAVGHIDNLIMRGFLNVETGTLDDSTDTVTADVVDYKWYFSKITKIRGRWYTVNGSLPQPFGSPRGAGNTKMKYEIFRAGINQDSGHSGYFQNAPCVFNEGGVPDCNTSTKAGNKCIFKYKEMVTKDGRQYVDKENYDAKYWTYSSILAHMVYYWINPYAGQFVTIKISSNSYNEISRYLKDEEATPMGFSIEDMNPLDALDSVVSSMPGQWIWWLEYHNNLIYIQVRNVGKVAYPAKKFYIGDGSKQAVKPANIASVSVVRDVTDAAKYYVAKGGKIRFTTTVELSPVWKDTEVQGVDVPFISEKDFGKWREYSTGKIKDEDLTKEEIARFSNAYKRYYIPTEGSFIKDSIEQLRQSGMSTHLDGELGSLYGSIEDDVLRMFANNVKLDRNLEAPCNPNYENIVIFGWDEYLDKSVEVKDTNKPNSQVKTDMEKSVSKLILYDDDDFKFDSDTGVLEFTESQHARAKITIDSKNTTREKKDIIMPAGITKDGKTSTRSLKSRRVFATLCFTVDIPLVAGKEKRSGIERYSGSDFSKYVDIGDIDLSFHANAWYPVKDLADVIDTGLTKNLTADGEIAVYSKYLSRCDNMVGYEKYPDKGNTVILNKLKNFMDSTNWYAETVAADLGILDVSYKLGDSIVAIVNSETEERNSGYYGLKDYVSQLEISLNGDNKGYSTTITATNEVDYTPKTTEDNRVDEIRRPGILRRGGSLSNDSVFYED